jgi:hypothetical protein
VFAAEGCGAVPWKVFTALEQVDSSSGARSARPFNRAMEELAPIIASTPVNLGKRAKMSRVRRRSLGEEGH